MSGNFAPANVAPNNQLSSPNGKFTSGGVTSWVATAYTNNPNYQAQNLCPSANDFCVVSNREKCVAYDSSNNYYEPYATGFMEFPFQCPTVGGGTAQYQVLSNYVDGSGTVVGAPDSFNNVKCCAANPQLASQPSGQSSEFKEQASNQETKEKLVVQSVNCVWLHVSHSSLALVNSTYRNGDC